MTDGCVFEDSNVTQS